MSLTDEAQQTLRRIGWNRVDPGGRGGAVPSICVSGFGGPLAEAARKRGADKGPGSQRARPRAGKKKSVKSLRRRRKRYRPVTRRRPGEERPRFLSCAAIKIASLKSCFDDNLYKLFGAYGKKNSRFKKKKLCKYFWGLLSTKSTREFFF